MRNHFFDEIVQTSNFICMRNKTSARSWFCATQKLGFVSHPIKNLSRLENDTEKHPSPSVKPEIYSFRSLCFVFSVCVLWCVIVLLHDSTIPVATGWRRPKSIRGQFARRRTTSHGILLLSLRHP